jgi:hypothetical protein
LSGYTPCTRFTGTRRRRSPRRSPERAGSREPTASGGHAGAGFRVTIDRRLPRFIRGDVADGLTAFLATQGLSPADINAWVCHRAAPRSSGDLDPVGWTFRVTESVS